MWRSPRTPRNGPVEEGGLLSQGEASPEEPSGAAGVAAAIPTGQPILVSASSAATIVDEDVGVPRSFRAQSSSRPATGRRCARYTQTRTCARPARGLRGVRATGGGRLRRGLEDASEDRSGALRRACAVRRGHL